MGGTRHSLKYLRHIRQTVVRQMGQRSRPAVEDTLHIVQHRQNHLVFLADLMQVEATSKVAEQGFIQ
jgi:hypothetical protein